MTSAFLSGFSSVFYLSFHLSGQLANTAESGGGGGNLKKEKGTNSTTMKLTTIYGTNQFIKTRGSRRRGLELSMLGIFILNFSEMSSFM